MTIKEEKFALRREIRGQVGRIPIEERESRSRHICNQLLALPEIKDSPFLLAFASMRTEPNLDALWTGSLNLVFPLVVGDELELWHVPEEDCLTIGSFGIREPVPERCEMVSIAEIDTILVPGVAFCPSNGLRLGRGGGFYDRLLAQARAQTIGICFTEQLRDHIPSEPHDCTVDGIIPA